jgi:hypothetical protein
VIPHRPGKVIAPIGHRRARLVWIGLYILLLAIIAAAIVAGAFGVLWLIAPLGVALIVLSGSLTAWAQHPWWWRGPISWNCRKCGYDLRGLSIDNTQGRVRCPECASVNIVPGTSSRSDG